MNKPVMSLNPEHQRIYAEAWRRREQRIGRIYAAVTAAVWLLIMLSVLCE